jgi:hypothetical protein
VVAYLGPSELLFTFEAVCLGSKALCASVELCTHVETSIFLEQAQATASATEKKIGDPELCFLRVPVLRYKFCCDFDVTSNHILCYDRRKNFIHNLNFIPEVNYKFSPARMASATAFKLPNEAKGKCKKE